MFRRRMIGLLASVALAVTGAGVMALPASAAAPPMPMVATVAPVTSAGGGIAARAGVAPMAANAVGSSQGLQANAVPSWGCASTKTYPVGPGSTGPAVSYLQCMLGEMYFGRSDGYMGPAGTFGNLTKEAVWDFKVYAFGKATDAIVGPTTWTMLILTYLGRPDIGYSPGVYGCPTAAHPVLTRGSTGAPVVMLQCLLNWYVGHKLQRPLEVDGIFGLRTWNAVLELKRWFNKPATDGIVGPGTWDILLWTCQCGG